MQPCVTRENPNYDADRRISNARFDYKPASICYCENEDDVARVLSTAKPGAVRIRSGGHQHEGMCSGNDVTIIDISKINAIEVVNVNGLWTATIGAGARLQDVYKRMFQDRLLLPGGGCGDVCIGGLVQGGGWGPYGRSLGFTCDQLRGFRIVQADGTILDVTNLDNDPHKKLFWAVAGGGGGNFGVVTHFKFDLAPLTGPITSFTVSWDDRDLTGPVTNEWRRRFPPDGDLRLTSFCRLTALAGGATLDYPIVVAGFFLGDQSNLEHILPILLPTTYAKKRKVDFSRVDTVGTSFQHSEYQPGPPQEAVSDSDLTDSDLTSTCDGTPFPHKVSSCYPRVTFGDNSVEVIASYLAASGTEPTARRYLSLHSMGGAMERLNNRSCFAYREKRFILQYQAWWGNKEQKEVGDRCMKWVKDFREAMEPHTEGSFINFPDEDLPASDRKALLRYYYRNNLEELIRIKGQYDPGKLFEFPMGIPTS